MSMKKMMLLMVMILLFTGIVAGENYTLPTYEELDAAGAFDTMRNASNASQVTINLDDYYIIHEMSTWDENATEYENELRMISAPVTYGASDDFAGEWFYVFLILVILIFVHGKVKSIEVTSMVMLVMGILLIMTTVTTGTILPPILLTLMYTLTILGVAGVFYSFFGGD